MGICAGLAAGLGLLLAATAASASVSACAQAPPGDAEVYVADVREAPPELGISSSIELRQDGRFVWRFTMEQLTLSAVGEWESGGGMIELTNPEQVGEPTMELTGSARDDADVLRVSLEPATARMASVLELELEYPDHYFASVAFEAGEARLPAGEERPIAVRLVSTPFAFRTQPIELAPDGDNVLTLRLVPADLGQAFFSSQSNAFDDSGMTLDWRGIALRYRRSRSDAGE